MELHEILQKIIPTPQFCHGNKREKFSQKNNFQIHITPVPICVNFNILDSNLLLEHTKKT